MMMMDLQKSADKFVFSEDLLYTMSSDLFSIVLIRSKYRDRNRDRERERYLQSPSPSVFFEILKLHPQPPHPLACELFACLEWDTTFLVLLYVTYIFFFFWLGKSQAVFKTYKT